MGSPRKGDGSPRHEQAAEIQRRSNIRMLISAKPSPVRGKNHHCTEHRFTYGRRSGLHDNASLGEPSHRTSPPMEGRTIAMEPARTISRNIASHQGRTIAMNENARLGEPSLHCGPFFARSWNICAPLAGRDTGTQNELQASKIA